MDFYFETEERSRDGFLDKESDLALTLGHISPKIEV